MIKGKMRLAVFHYKVIENNPSGSCMHKMISAVSKDHEIVVFANEFDRNIKDHNIEWVKVPLLKRPMVLMFLTFHIIAPIVFLIHKLKGNKTFDKVIISENNLLFGDISYVHFCHKEYLEKHFKLSEGGMLHFFYFLNHFLRALIEPLVYKRIKGFIVPSNGIKRELERVYPFTKNKIKVIYNTVDIEKVRKRLNAKVIEKKWQTKNNRVELCFIALGHFQRKGLDIILYSLQKLQEEHLMLTVVGGSESLISVYKEKAKSLGIEDYVKFTGFQKNVYRFLEHSHVFIFPTNYEIFPLVSLEAAAAGLPLIVTKVYGVEEFMIDGETGILIERTSESVIKALREVIKMNPIKLKQMGLLAQKEIETFSIDRFDENWRTYLNNQLC